MSDSEEIDELEQNQDVQNISVFRKREKIHVNDDELIEMDSLKKLNHMLTCPICLDIFQEPVYVKGCSHRFCKECIEKAIRSSKTKQCPTCRKIIGTKRLLRIDYNVQEIINLVYGDIAKFLELKQTNEELLVQKAYSHLLNNADGTHKKRRKHLNNQGTEKGHDNQAQSSPTFSNHKDDYNSGKGAANGASYKNSQQEQHAYPSNIKKKYSTSGANSNAQQGQGSLKNGEKGMQQQESVTSRKRKLENLGETSGFKKGEEFQGLNKKRFFEEEMKEKQLEEELKRQNNNQLLLSDTNQGGSLYTSSTIASSSINKADRVFINIQIKVIPYDKLTKQFDFYVCKIDWQHSLDDITKLICQKLNISYTKYKQSIKLFTKSQTEDASNQIYHPLEDKTQLLKNVEDQFWSVETQQGSYVRRYNKIDQAINLSTDYIHQKGAQQKVLFYNIEHKDVVSLNQ